jgi:hypothetical protein
MNNPPPSIWQLKPWWCQPWSILLTGISMISVSWLLFHRLWVTGLVAVPILTWMGFFLLIYPPAMQAALRAESEAQEAQEAQGGK